MRVLVRVEMSKRYTLRLKRAELGSCFRLNLPFVDSARESSRRESSQASAKLRRLMAIHKCGKQRRIRDGVTIDEDHVTANSQVAVSGCEPNRIGSSVPVGHQGGGGNDSALVSFRNGAIYTGSQAKVIGIDDEAAHAGKCSRQNAAQPESVGVVARVFDWQCAVRPIALTGFCKMGKHFRIAGYRVHGGEITPRA